MQQIIFLFFLTLRLFLSASDTFSVSLDTETPLDPIYVTPIEGSAFDQKYTEELIRILSYDLNHNGMSVTVRSSEKALYIIKWSVQSKTIQPTLYVVHERKSKKIDSFTFTGKINQDRRLIHQIADTLFKSIYGTEGVASTTILYTVREKNQDPVFKSEYLSEVWQCDFDGHNPRQVTHEGRYIVTPCYVPAKKGFRPGSFLFVSYKLGQPKIYLGCLEDGSSHQLLSLRGNQFMPAITRNKADVAFICDAMGNPDLFVVPYNDDLGVGKPRQIFASPRGTQGSPCFSPDGRQIAFVSNKDGNTRVYMMDIPSPHILLKEMSPRLISRACRESTSPSWSPDGRKIAYAGLIAGTRQIFVYDRDSQTEEQITTDKSNKENPCFAADSFHIVFNADQSGGKAQLAVVNLKQKETVLISEGNTDKRFPSAEPLVK